MRKFVVNWTESAACDLEEILTYITHSRPLVAQDLYRRIKSSCQKLTTNPERCRIVPELQMCSVLRYRELVIAPYRVIFRIDRSSIYVIAVFDSRRDVEELLLRRLLRD